MISSEKINPSGISSRQEKGLMLTAQGNPQSFLGQIWETASDRPQFLETPIIDKESKNYKKLSGSSYYYEPRKLLFSCSNKEDTNAEVVIFKKEAGSFLWEKTIVFLSPTKEYCNGLAVIGKYLFAINSKHSSKPGRTAVYYADISESDAKLFPDKMTALESYDDLPEIATLIKSKLTGIIPQVNNKKGEWGIYVFGLKSNNKTAKGGFRFHFIFKEDNRNPAHLVRQSMISLQVPPSDYPVASLNIDDEHFVMFVRDDMGVYLSQYDEQKKIGTPVLLGHVCYPCSKTGIGSLTFGDDVFQKTDMKTFFVAYSENVQIENKQYKYLIQEYALPSYKTLSNIR